MTKTPVKRQATRKVRLYPKVKITDAGAVEVELPNDASLQDMIGVKTRDAANGLLVAALSALGKDTEPYRQLMAAIFAEVEPRDAVEAMLASQMCATHVAMSAISCKMGHQTNYQARESCERSMTRLSRTYLAQMDALRKYRAKAQQVVRVERVTVHDGGQAIVGDVTHGGRSRDEK